MNAEQILKLVDAVSRSDLSELKYEGDGVKLTLKKSDDRKAAIPAAVVSSGCAAADSISEAETETVSAVGSSAPAAVPEAQNAENEAKA